MTWEEIAADKKARIDKSIPDEWRISVEGQDDSVMDVPAKSGILSAQELEITNSSAVDLVAKLASGQLKSVDVTLAFCKRAALAHELVRRLYPYPYMAICGQALTWNNAPTSSTAH
jgi:amidase